MTAPTILRGAAAIGAHIDMPAEQIEALHAMRVLPTFELHEMICATRGGIDEWCECVSLVFSR